MLRPSLGARRSAEFAVAEGGGEGGPSGRGEDQGAAGGVLGVAYRDGLAGGGNLDAVGLVAAAAALPPAGGAQVGCKHGTLLSAVSSGPRRPARR